MSSYIHTPKTININDIEKKDYNLSSSQYKGLVMPNNNYKLVKEFLSRKLNRKDLGIEVGSLSYIDKSPYFFIRTKALQEHSYLPNFTNETALPIMPSEFVQMNLKEGDLLISKDSNIGEIVILDKDYPNHMLSGAIYKLPIKDKWKYYLLAFIKHDIFREQLDFMVPKGATIRHAKTMFLDCKIPLPKNNNQDAIKYISVLMQSIINKEKLIRYRHNRILKLIEEELVNNQGTNTFTYNMPKYEDLLSVGRLDTSIYSEDFLKKQFLITNYKRGYKSFLELNNGQVELSRGQNLQESNIGKSVYSEKQHKGYYSLCLSKHYTKYQTISKFLYLGNRLRLKTIKKGEIIFSCRGEMGRIIMFCDTPDNIITNIDNIHINFPKQPLFKTIYISQILTYLKEIGFIRNIAITGSGADSFTKYQFDMLLIPEFPEIKQKEISSLYYCEKCYKTHDLTLNTFLQKDDLFNEQAGIYELDKSAKHIRLLLDRAINEIINDQDVTISFDI